MPVNIKRISFMKRAYNRPEIIAQLTLADIHAMFLELALFDNEDNAKSFLYDYAERRDKSVLKYAALAGEFATLSQYSVYLAFRAEHPTDTASVSYLEAAYGSREVAEQRFNMRFKNRPSPYDPIYVSSRDGVTLTVARKQIARYKSEKATNRIGFMARHGDEIGSQMFADFQASSAKPMQFEHWSQYYEGEETAENAFKKMKKTRFKSSLEYWYKRGFSEEDARAEVSQYQRENSGVSEEYYRRRGVTDAQILVIMADINRRRDGSSLSGIMEKYPEMTLEQATSRYETINGTKSVPQTRDLIEKRRKTFENKGIWVPLDRLPEYVQYKREVMFFTRRQPIETLNHYEKRGVAGKVGAYHLDHIYSKRRGYLDGVSAEIIGSIVNLRFIPFEINVSKQDNCDISYTDLLEQWRSFNED